MTDSKTYHAAGAEVIVTANLYQKSIDINITKEEDSLSKRND